jgi:hypothetical protein
VTFLYLLHFFGLLLLQVTALLFEVFLLLPHPFFFLLKLSFKLIDLFAFLCGDVLGFVFEDVVLCRLFGGLGHWHTASTLVVASKENCSVWI